MPLMGHNLFMEIQSGLYTLQKEEEETWTFLLPFLLWQPQGPIDLQWENFYHDHNSFSFDRMFLKFAEKLDMDEISNKLKNWPD